MGPSKDQGYPRPELLAEPDWLWQTRDDPKLRLVDCAGPDAYGRAHIPGAVGLPVDVWIKEPEGGVHVMGAEKFADLMSGLGVSDDTIVVCYDDWVTAYATRLWWVLNYYGHANVKVLNGGWHRWVVEGRPITFHETEPEPCAFHRNTERSDDMPHRRPAPKVQGRRRSGHQRASGGDVPRD